MLAYGVNQYLLEAMYNNWRELDTVTVGSRNVVMFSTVSTVCE